MPDLTVFFDGHCALCRASAARVRQFDFHGRIELVDLHERTLAERFPEVDSKEAMKWMLAVDRQGRVYGGADAWARIGLLLPGWNLLAWMLLVPGVHGLARKAYAWIARNRYRARRAACAEDSCRVHFDC